ncbi:MAG: hypothetical protein QF824_01125 [Candidatus Woesearchaeota archaeon]|jgi:hypothetical protein|nr:hypothetical protein [Candidatus Woesearchaeota archaeon]
MQNTKGVEGFLADFLNWYGPFLEGVRKFDLYDVYGEAHRDRDIIPIVRGEAESRIGFPYMHPADFHDTLERGSLFELVESERELQTKVDELNGTHETSGVPSLKYLNGLAIRGLRDSIRVPQYDLFVPEIKFKVGWEGCTELVVSIDYSDGLSSYHPTYELGDGVSVGFSPTVSVPRGRTSGRVDHSEGEGVASLRYGSMTPISEGFFCHEGEQVFDFRVGYGQVDRVEDGDFTLHGDMMYRTLAEKVWIPNDMVGTGALTRFMEMLGENPNLYLANLNRED